MIALFCLHPVEPIEFPVELDEGMDVEESVENRPIMTNAVTVAPSIFVS